MPKGRIVEKVTVFEVILKYFLVVSVLLMVVGRIG